MRARIVLLALSIFLVTGLLLPAADARDDTWRGQVLEDGKECFVGMGLTKESTCAVLYPHILDLLDRAPLNLQFPERVPEEADGFTTFPTVEPIYDFNQLAWFPSPAFVEDEPGLDIHHVGGIASDLTVDGTLVPIVGFLYMLADADEISMAGLDGPVDSGAMPCMTVRFSVSNGLGPGSSEVLAQGSTTKTVLTAPAGAPGSIEDPCPEAEGEMEAGRLSEFRVELPIGLENISRRKAFRVAVEWWQHDAAGHQVAQREWNVVRGPDVRPRLVLPIRNAFRAHDPLVTGIDDGRVSLQFNVSSPFGSYDVDPASVVLRVQDETGAVVSAEAVETRLEFRLDHEAAVAPPTLRITWDAYADGAHPGNYTAEIRVRNWQNTAEDNVTFRFEIRAEDLEGRNRFVPAPSLPVLLAGPLLVLALLFRRRALGANDR